MLKRSPKSKYLIIFGTTAGIIAAFTLLNSALTLNKLANSHGNRVEYAIVTNDINLGDKIESTNISSHEMFSSDAPPDAIQISSLKENNFATTQLKTGTIITKEMVAANSSKILKSNERIIFIPATEKLSSSLSEKTDILSYTDGEFGSQSVATNATILFDASNTGDDTDDSPTGYFVIVTQDEAKEIMKALSTGDVRFALING